MYDIRHIDRQRSRYVHVGMLHDCLPELWGTPGHYGYVGDAFDPGAFGRSMGAVAAGGPMPGLVAGMQDVLVAAHRLDPTAFLRGTVNDATTAAINSILGPPGSRAQRFAHIVHAIDPGALRVTITTDVLNRALAAVARLINADIPTVHVSGVGGDGSFTDWLDAILLAYERADRATVVEWSALAIVVMVIALLLSGVVEGGGLLAAAEALLETGWGAAQRFMAAIGAAITGTPAIQRQLQMAEEAEDYSRAYVARTAQSVSTAASTAVNELTDEAGRIQRALDALDSGAATIGSRLVVQLQATASSLAPRLRAFAGPGTVTSFTLQQMLSHAEALSHSLTTGGVRDLMVDIANAIQILLEHYGH